MFSTLPNLNFNFWVTFILLSANAFSLEKLEILLFGRELTGKISVGSLIYISELTLYSELQIEGVVLISKLKILIIVD